MKPRGIIKAINTGVEADMTINVKAAIGCQFSRLQPKGGLVPLAVLTNSMLKDRL